MNISLNSLWICSQLSPLRISTWCMVLRHFWLGLEPTLPVRRAVMLTARPPSPLSQYLFLLHMLLYWFSRLISVNQFVIGSFVFLENIINFFSILHTLHLSSANQSPVTLQVQVINQSKFSDVSLGSSSRFSITHGDCFNTFSLFIHSVRITN